MSSSSSDDEKTSLVFVIGKTDPDEWCENMEAWLNGKYTPADGDLGAAVLKQKANILPKVKGRRKKEVRAWADAPDSDLIPGYNTDGDDTVQSWNGGTVLEILQGVTIHFNEDPDGGKMPRWTSMMMMSTSSAGQGRRLPP